MWASWPGLGSRIPTRSRRRHLRLGNVDAAIAAGADVSTTVILASGNRELQTHVDLVVARTTRLVAATAEDDVWQVWVVGYRETLDLLEVGRHGDALARYRQIYADYRGCVETMLFDS